MSCGGAGDRSSAPPPPRRPRLYVPAGLKGRWNLAIAAIPWYILMFLALICFLRIFLHIYCIFELFLTKKRISRIFCTYFAHIVQEFPMHIYVFEQYFDHAFWGQFGLFYYHFVILGPFAFRDIFFAILGAILSIYLHMCIGQNIHCITFWEIYLFFMSWCTSAIFLWISIYMFENFCDSCPLQYCILTCVPLLSSSSSLPSSREVAFGAKAW